MAYPLTKADKNKLKRWSRQGQKIFRKTYSEILLYVSNDVFAHPAAPKLKKNHWKTIAWNSAWIAADAADGKI